MSLLYTISITNDLRDPIISVRERSNAGITFADVLYNFSVSTQWRWSIDWANTEICATAVVSNKDCAFKLCLISMDEGWYVHGSYAVQVTQQKKEIVQ